MKYELQGVYRAHAVLEHG